MAFVCENELDIRGGTETERRAAADIILATGSVVDEGQEAREVSGALLLRFASLDGLPEEELGLLAPQFPELSLLLVYCSLDGEFYGMTSSGPRGGRSESEDFDDRTRELIGRKFDGDSLAFVRRHFELEASPLR